jgi:hypothetical protein
MSGLIPSEGAESQQGNPQAKRAGLRVKLFNHVIKLNTTSSNIIISLNLNQYNNL